MAVGILAGGADHITSGPHTTLIRHTLHTLPVLHGRHRGPFDRGHARTPHDDVLVFDSGGICL
ncbi:hypothetical protein D9V32_05445, partial [Mycetocola tolaasinivorans]